ncbi:MAG: hypothetical protein WAT71_10165 [Ignavibacteria bacterium]
MSIKLHLHNLSELMGSYSLLLFLLLVSFGWLFAWLTFIVLAIFFAR